MSVELAAIALDNCACFTTTMFIIIPSRLPAKYYLGVDVSHFHLLTWLRLYQSFLVF